MKIAVIGGTGHVGTYLVPRLVSVGHDVVCISRGKSTPYQEHPAWDAAIMVEIDRDAEEKQGNFGPLIAELKPDIVIDMICFTLDSVRQITESLKGRVQHFLSTGTIWVHGPSCVVPTGEEAERNPFGEYGIQKAQIEEYLLKEARTAGFPATILHPGHIVGEGWPPINPAGHLNLEVFENLIAGKMIKLPNLGMETLHHVHADDVASGFIDAINSRNTSAGESFHIVSSAAITLRGFAEAVASWFGKKPNLSFLPWDEWKKTVSAPEAELTLDHIAHSPNCSIDKARKMIGFEPRYSSLDAVHQSLQWLIKNGQITIASEPPQ